MAAQHGGLVDGLVVLEVLLAELDLPEQATAAQIQEAGRQSGVPRLVQRAAELHERGLHLGMPAHGIASALAEDLAQMVRDPHCGCGEVIRAGGAQARDRRLEHVARAVQLVPPLEVRVARLLALMAEARVEVAVALLRRRDHGGELLEAAFHVRITGAPDLPGHRFHQLVHVGVGELPALAHCGDGPLDHGREVAHPTQLFHPGLGVRNGGECIALEVGRPRTTGDCHRVESEREVPSRVGMDRADGGGVEERRSGHGDSHFTAPTVSPSRRSR